jgi:AraC family transcriptional regulator, regulatory protein of adaptative response / methylated-DNA-[protein]-cysteine methyltransferase
MDIEMSAVKSIPAAPTGFVTDAQKWRAVQQRDGAADSAFVYSVRSTGVYCRPSCASRQPLRTNVQFHADATAAERAGYRPCKRCKPDRTKGEDPQVAAVAKACRLIETSAELPQLDELAAATGLSRFHFHRVFKAIAGVTPKAYADAHRARRVRDQLKESGSITEAIYDAGFNSSSRFYTSSTDRLGMTPTTFRAGGAGANIRFAVATCSLGQVLVAATDQGICRIQFGADAEALIDELRAEFPKAQLSAGGKDFANVLAKVVEFVEAPQRGLELPLHVRGTAFQQRVWQALRAIPAGATASYAQIARQIEAPQAVRAVAQACGANPTAVAIPCHRVVRSDGALSGYRWGVQRKRALLKREGMSKGEEMPD